MPVHGAEHDDSWRKSNHRVDFDLPAWCSSALFLRFACRAAFCALPKRAARRSSPAKLAAESVYCTK
jgi:hypothetical protein